MATALTVTSLSKRVGTHRVDRNLYLRVKPRRNGKPGGKLSTCWLFRYMHDGGERWMGLGALDDVSLAEASDEADKHRKALKRLKIDPLEVRRGEVAAKKLEAAKSISFGECAKRYVAAHERSWKNAKHRAQWRATFGLDPSNKGNGKRKGKRKLPPATEVINALPVAEIDTALAMKVLDPIWAQKPETASRVRQRCEQVIAWATVNKFRDGANPFLWKGHLDNLLAEPTKLKRVVHHPALPYAEMPTFMAELRRKPFVSAKALEFTILTAARTNETIGARLDEINLAEKVWVIPAERMKAEREHRVPLSERAIEILSQLPRERGNPFVFIGGKEGEPLSNMAMLELLKAMRPGYTVHGTARSSFDDWAHEETNFPSHVIDMALAHKIKDKTEAAYRRGDLFAKRRLLMNAWAKYCGTPAALVERIVSPPTGNVVALPGRRRARARRAQVA